MRTRGVGAGIIAGAVRGALGGAITLGVLGLVLWQVPFATFVVTFFLVPAVAVTVEWREPRLAARGWLKGLAVAWVVVTLLGLLALLLGGGVASPRSSVALRALAIAVGSGAALSAGESASARLEGDLASAVARVAGAAAAPIASFLLLLPIEIVERSLPSLYAPLAFKGDAGTLAGAGVVLVAGELAAGRPVAGEGWIARARRCARLVGGAGIASGALAFAILHPFLAPFVALLATAVGMVLTGVHAIALVAARPISLRVGRRLEPRDAWLDRRDRARAHAARVSESEEARRRGDGAAAVEAARAALDLSIEDPWLAPERREDARRLAHLLLDLDRLDELAAMPRECPDLAALRAEALRLRGDAAGAVAALRGEPGPRASVQAVLALAHADLREFDRARAELAGLRVACEVQGPLLDAHAPRRVAEWIAFRELTVSA